MSIRKRNMQIGQKTPGSWQLPGVRFLRFCYISEYQILFNGYGLCQVSRLIYIAAQFNGGVVSKQLHRDNRQRRGEQIRSIRNIEYLIRNAFYIGTAFAHNGNHISAAGLDFLYIADKLFISVLDGTACILG